MARLLLSLAAVCAAIFFGLRQRGASWSGEVYTAGTLPVADATLIIVKGTQFLSTARTGIDGKFQIMLPSSPGADGRLIVCRAGLEPAVAEWGARGTNGSVVQLGAADPSAEHPVVTSVKDGLPQECK